CSTFQPLIPKINSQRVLALLKVLGSNSLIARLKMLKFIMSKALKISPKDLEQALAGLRTQELLSRRSMFFIRTVLPNIAKWDLILGSTSIPHGRTFIQNAMASTF